MSVLHFERLLAAPGATDGLRDVAGQAVTSMRAAPGALWAEVASTEDGFLVLSEWRNAADLEAWERTEAARAFAQGREGLLGAEPTIRRFDPAP